MSTTKHPFKVIRHPQGNGYALTFVGGDKPSWMIRNYCMWFRYKRDALHKANVLNSTYEEKA